EAERQGVIDAQRVHRRREERRALELVARAKVDLREHVVPVGGEARRRRVPLRSERARLGCRLRLGLADVIQLERAADALAVEAEQRAAERLGAEGAAPGGEDAKLVAAPQRARAAEGARS